MVKTRTFSVILLIYTIRNLSQGDVGCGSLVFDRIFGALETPHCRFFHDRNSLNPTSLHTIFTENFSWP
ncbi:MAG: hypothetical protein HC895_10545 [Leptolyngbyaceae cyanobacterium SM1_3_5]|nr:hypothetical protein [Leptolyngbyaceae cyanobacterium SM1_3_5]